MSQQGREAAPCTYALRSGAGRFGPEGGSAVATVTTEARCSWSATTTDDWLTVDPTEGTGTASITFRAAPYTGATERKANIQVADQTWTVRQDPPSAAECTYSVTPAEIVLHWHHTGGEVRVSTRAGCSWTVSTGEAWLNVSGPTAREGDGGVQFTTGIYTVDGTRRAPIEVRWPTATAGQNVWVVHEGCRYGMDESTRTFTAAGGQAQVMVVTQPVSSSCMQGCPWTAVSDSSWIRILSGSPGVGDNPFSYEVLPNTTGVSRTGAITVMGHRVPIVQTP
ncbi:MAG TPA: BACON domain-containing carbohydrate-binding protein [Vicinamibacterales bacterium]|nr:BACON domain-containing carbohydrate-binding protein [Vicinamibacterales bacterium]